MDRNAGCCSGTHVEGTRKHTRKRCLVLNQTIALTWRLTSSNVLQGFRGSYESACKRFDPEDLEVDVTGRSFMVTGANSGIGKAAAKEIARRGGIVHLVCRNKDRAEEAKKEITTETSNENVFVHILDMSDPKGIWKFAEQYKNEHKLNVLINNAGCMMNQKELTADGLEKNFATNTLAVRTSMPEFYEKMKNRLRTEAQGADTVVWLAVSPAAHKQASGLFFQGMGLILFTWMGRKDTVFKKAVLQPVFRPALPKATAALNSSQNAADK
ncbi:dehydrogenase/reductase SDR family member 12 isoform X9 [Varanus komodoensis]|uniref:dehydrogenase/reductase SDR family member 12 isoform X9 n=1 Tax=Varanus komodoensis TaxID=61221 RepID=UPI001CF793E4|nr:dehydrogenase/reductase SDR family member 12 isoform X9 [Varanus komodoensis]